MDIGGASPRRYAASPSYAQRIAQNGNKDHVATPEPLRSAGSAMTRAEKFEDEKRRIMSSCFSKMDDSGVLLQSYITHIRVEEDAMHPSSPPPPEALPQYKKPRVIIVAVKSSGRVWVHKARENDDATFQIGKSWPMEDVQAIESFSNPVSLSPEALNKAQWAGSVGFMITMAKPYYWAANTAKEKEFFIGSLVKIYRKYTSGNVPQLIGFTTQERDQILGANAPPPQASQRVQTPPDSRLGQQSPSSPLQPPRPLGGSPGRRTPGSASPSSISSSTAPPLQPPPISQDRFVSQLQNARGATPQLSSRASQDSGLRQPPPIRDQQSSPRSLTPQSSHSNFMESRSNASGPPDFSKPRLGPSGLGPGQPEIQNFSQPRSNGGPAPLQSGFEPVPSGSYPSEFAQNGNQRALPERRRPPLQESDYSRSRGFSDQSDPNVVKPLAPKPSLPDTSRPSTSDRSTAQTPGGLGSQVSAPAPLNRNRSPGSIELPVDKPEGQGANILFARDISADEAAAAAEGEVTPVGEHEHYRPGLGPMLGGKTSNTAEVANKFRKAATAASAFKPRAGGAGERLLGAKAKTGNEPDGVTAVVPAPPKQESAQSTPVERRSEDSASQPSKPVERSTPLSAPALSVAKDMPKAAPTGEPASIYVNKDMISEGIPDSRTPTTAKISERAKKRRSNKYANCYITLDIDPLVLEGRASVFDEIFSDFGWEGSLLQTRKIEAMEQDIRREINRLEAGSWLGNSENKDDRVDLVASMLDKAIMECDEMEGLLTLYGVELGTLNDDISYIEAQSQGLQVQTANQKALQTELETLVSTVSITPKQMEPLQSASLGDTKGLESIESCLYLLYRALSTIDPSSFKNSASGHGNEDSPQDHTLGSMRALQDKRSGYMNQAYTFLGRLRNYMDPTIGAAFMKTADALSRINSSQRDASNTEAHEATREALWQYNPLMLFAKEIDSMAWGRIIETYQNRAALVYRDELRNTFEHWKAVSRKPTSEENSAVFTGHEKETDSFTGTARKLTVKRSQTLARGWRSNSLAKGTGMDKDPSTKREPHDSFACALSATVDVIAREQNFVVDFFHARSTETVNFIDVVTISTPANRKCPVYYPRPPEPDRIMAERINEAMNEIFKTWSGDLQNFVDNIVKDEPLQGVGILCALELLRAEQEDTDQDFVMKSVQKLHDHLSSLFNKFLDDQIRAIEDTKVKIKKRKGVIGFMKVFPHFSAAIEGGFPEDAAHKNLEVRSMVDSAYSRINKAMFDSLKAIAKESPVALPGGVGQSTDPDDKEALNYHILLIENMFHYTEVLDEHGDPVLTEWKDKAKREYQEHESLYISAVIRRPLGKLLDFLESTENLMSSGPGRAPTSIPTSHASHSRGVFKKVMSSYDAREVKKGISKLRERIEKHLTEDEPTAAGQQLMAQILKECEKKYVDVFERASKISREVYESSVEVDVGKEEISQSFRR